VEVRALHRTLLAAASRRAQLLPRRTSMSFLRTHGVACSIGHVIGATLYASGYSPEKWLVSRVTPALDGIVSAAGIGSSFSAVVPFWPTPLEAWMMLFVTMGLFMIVTMSGASQKDEVFGDAGLDENIEASRQEFFFMRLGMACGYAVGFFAAGLYGWKATYFFPASAVGIPIAFFLLFVIASIAAAWLSAGCAYLNICPRARTAAEVFGKAADARSPAKVLRRNLGISGDMY